MKSLSKKVGRALLAVVHDPAVGRAAKSAALLALVRLAIALGASAELVQLLEKLQ